MKKVQPLNSGEKSMLSWETLSTTTRYGQYSSAIERSVLTHALEVAGAPTTSLEIGCEGGRWAKLLAQYGWQMTCTDVNAQALEICQQRIPSATCLLMQPEEARLPLPDASQHLLVCIQVGPVVHADWFLNEAARVLDRGGILMSVIWNRTSWRGLLYHHVPALRGGNNYWYGYPLSYPRWRKGLLERFTLVHEEGYSWLPFHRGSNASIIPLAAKVERLLFFHRLPLFSPMIAFIAKKR